MYHSLKNFEFFFFVFAFIINNSFEVFSQKRNFQINSPNEKYARDYMMAGNYISAINEYNMLLKNDSLNTSYNHNIGICYLNSSINRGKAVYYLEKASQLPKVDPYVWYDLGRAYMYVYRFDDAIKSYTKFRELVPGKSDNFITPERQIEICNNAKELIKNPVNVVFENLGPSINSPYPDYYPFISRDESLLIFNSKRKGNTGNLEDFDGYNTPDIYMSEYKYGNWKKVKRFSNNVNTPLAEEIVGMSPDGTRIFIFMDNEYASSTVFESRLVDKNYQKPVPLGSNINVSNKFVSSATISKDKKTLFFSADYGTKEGYGGLDIYMATLLPTGEWGKPVNVGNIINTPYDEDFPNLSSDGQTLYFASIGHNTMGDYDIFKTTWNKTDNTFSQPVNIGYPVNTPEDNKTISFTSSGRYAYMHAKRDDSYGDLDIYRLIFKDVEPVYSVVNGYILTVDSILVFKDFNSKNNKTAISNNGNKSHNNKDESNDISVKKLNTLEINIEVYNKSDSTLYGKYTPDKNTSRYTIILPPGDFTVNIKSNFFDDYLFDISIMDRDSRDTYINRNIKLKYK